MALDGIILSKIKDDFITKLPIRINKISQINQTDLIFNVHCLNKRTNILISCHSLYNRIHFTNNNYDSLENVNNFVLTLRKRLTNSIIYDIIQNDYDRYLIFKIKSLDIIYDDIYYDLHIELMGKYANIILVDTKTNKIIDALKKSMYLENTKRLIQVGALFTYVDKQNKIDPFTYNNSIDNISKKFQGFSFCLEKEFSYRLNKQSFQSIIQEIKTSNSIYYYDKEYHIIELKHLNEAYKQYEIHQGFDEIYNQVTKKEAIKLIANDLFKLVKNKLNHFKNKKIKITEQIYLANNCEEYKNYGDLLYMSGNLNQKGLDNIHCQDYNDHEVVIKLDPKLNIKQNANKYYQKYQKLKRSLIHQENQLSITEKEIKYFEALFEQLDYASYNDALDIKQDLINKRYILDKKNNKKMKVKKPVIYKVNYLDNIIYYGKNNIQNSYLTFKKANKYQWWFHAKDYHGAHVVLDGQLNEETIRLCAMIAGYYSKARNSSSIQVDYCQVKDLKKIEGAFVSLSNYKSIFIDIDAELLKELKVL